RVPLRSRPTAGPHLFHRYAAADRLRIAARRPRVFEYPNRHHRQVSADARQARLLSDGVGDRKSTRLNSSHSQISYAVFCLKKKKQPCACPPAPTITASLLWLASMLSISVAANTTVHNQSRWTQLKTIPLNSGKLR